MFWNRFDARHNNNMQPKNFTAEHVPHKIIRVLPKIFLRVIRNFSRYSSWEFKMGYPVYPSALLPVVQLHLYFKKDGLAAKQGH